MVTLVTYYLPFSYNALCLPLKILHNYCFQFLLGITVIPRKIQDNVYAKEWGGGAGGWWGKQGALLYICLCENGEL